MALAYEPYAAIPTDGSPVRESARTALVIGFAFRKFVLTAGLIPGALLLSVPPQRRMGLACAQSVRTRRLRRLMVGFVALTRVLSELAHGLRSLTPRFVSPAREPRPPTGERMSPTSERGAPAVERGALTAELESRTREPASPTSRYDSLTTGHAWPATDHERLTCEHEALTMEHDSLTTVRESLTTGHESLTPRFESLTGVWIDLTVAGKGLTCARGVSTLGRV